MTLPDRIVERFQSRVGGDPDSCWEWPMSTGSHGYGQMGWVESGRREMALTHRISWEIEHGPIPDDLTIDHLCRNRICCNPAHLRLLPNSVNGSDNGNAQKTHCPKGHAYSESNTYRTPSAGDRRCIKCARKYRREYRARTGK